MLDARSEDEDRTVGPLRLVGVWCSYLFVSEFWKVWGPCINGRKYRGKWGVSGLHMEVVSVL